MEEAEEDLKEMELKIQWGSMVELWEEKLLFEFEFEIGRNVKKEQFSFSFEEFDFRANNKVNSEWITNDKENAKFTVIVIKLNLFEGLVGYVMTIGFFGKEKEL